MPSARRIIGAYVVASLAGCSLAYLAIAMMLVLNHGGRIGAVSGQLFEGLMAFTTHLYPKLLIAGAPFTLVCVAILLATRKLSLIRFKIAGVLTPLAAAATLGLYEWAIGHTNGEFASSEVVLLIGIFGAPAGLVAGYIFWRLGFRKFYYKQVAS